MTARRLFRLFRLFRLGVVAGFLLAAPAAAEVDDGWVLPPSAGTTFAALMTDVNEHHALGDSVTMTDVRIEGTFARLVLVDRGGAPPVTVVLEHRGTPGDGRPRFFAPRIEPRDERGALRASLSKLGPLLDARFSSDPWTLAVQMPRAEVRAAAHPAPREDYILRSRGKVLGGVVVVFALSLGILIALGRLPDVPPAD